MITVHSIFRHLEAEIITIGDEILIGQTVDTNSAWLAQRFNELGIGLSQIRSVKDEEEAIKSAIQSVENRAIPITILTGGLGPTKDDITKRVLCDYFDTHLVMNEEVLLRIEGYFKARGREMLESNRQQAMLPKSCEVLPNEVGTASGMLFRKEDRIVVSLPGVPYEMKSLFSKQLLPIIESSFQLPVIYHKTIMTEGIGESFLVEIIKSWEDSLDEQAIKIAYLPSPGIVRVRLSAFGEDKEAIKKVVDKKAAELYSLVPSYIFGEDDISIEQGIANLLIKHNLSVATAESCTGGYLAHLFTSVPGSSSYFEGSIVSYSNAVKQNALGVDAQSIQLYGAVSKEVVSQMALGVQQRLNVDYALATSGVAGPDGGSKEKPVGTVWIAIAGPKGVYAKQFLFEKNRQRNVRRSALAALSLLRRSILGQLEY